ncbi:hypothetical protein HDG34_003182 [Paraburkholderia sp. HC6.4b]|uniref:hypothetical protein n=1 Tax=unclassified Paraburkholderia TaxID=2615204 RepID=UPI0016071569|nr:MULTISPECIES: hypothetical protein [unclassified Paraburkholderia]MBB5409241.1 hypothetical protein [Paraburkholderia sp. HC6.4b]MBB5450969.1 hypothetical protein [Paraburkholderia sp. Kb1A]
MSSLLKLALEEDASGANFHEIEYVFYARLPEVQPEATGSLPTVAPPSGFTSAERHEQWEIKVPQSDANGGRGTIRIRRTTWPDERGKAAQYVLTTKVKLKDGTNSEVPIGTTGDNFRQFRVLAESGMLKDRYTYPVAEGALPESMGHGLKWEVDFFHRSPPEASGAPGAIPRRPAWHPWVKIDLEVRQRISPLATTEIDSWPFPFEAEEWIVNQRGGQTPEEEARIDEIYERCFLIRNPYARATLPSHQPDSRQPGAHAS